MQFLWKLFGKAKKGRFRCEICGAPLICRTSWYEHIFMRRELYQCDFVPCSQSYWGRTELTHAANRSGLPGSPPSQLPMQNDDYVRMAAHVYRYNQHLASQKKGEQQLELLETALEDLHQPVREDIAS